MPTPETTASINAFEPEINDQLELTEALIAYSGEEVVAFTAKNHELRRFIELDKSTVKGGYMDITVWYWSEGKLVEASLPINEVPASRRLPDSVIAAFGKRAMAVPTRVTLAFCEEGESHFWERSQSHILAPRTVAQELPLVTTAA